MISTICFSTLVAGLLAGAPSTSTGPLEKRVAANPRDEKARLQLAQEYTRSGQAALAHQQLEAVGNLYEQSARNEEAYVLFRKLADEDRAYWSRVSHLQEVLGPDAAHAAMLVFELSRLTDPAQRAGVEQSLAELRAKMAAEKRTPASLPDLEKAYAANLADDQARFRLVSAYRAGGDTAKAVALLEKAGDADAAQRHLLKAIRAYGQALEVDASSLPVRKKLAGAQATLELYQDAADQYEVLASVYEKRGMKNERAEALKQRDSMLAKVAKPAPPRP